MNSQAYISQIKKQTLFFIAITFIFTYGFNLWLYLNFQNISQFPPYSTLIQMLIPAAVAILLLFCFNRNNITNKSKIFFGLFFLYVFIFLWEMLAGSILPDKLIQLPVYRFMPTVSIIVAFCSIIILFLMNIRIKWREGLALTKLSFGSNLKYYSLTGVLFSILLFAIYYLNHLLAYGNPLEAYDLKNFVTIFAMNLIIGFFVGWPFYFGEEYGWRVYLQDRLFPIFGGIKGVILLGLIWGLWHSGLILMGMNYPEQPVLGNLVMIMLSIIVGIFFSYAVLKTGSVWIAVILHLIIDTVEPAALFYISFPSDPIFSFGMGLYGITIMGIFALLLIILDRKVWKRANILEK